jgi:hypothetical protein
MGNNNKHSFNDTQIKNGRIVKVRKDGRIKADLGPYIVNRTKTLFTRKAEK